jgi:hypothetical protein
MCHQVPRWLLQSEIFICKKMMVFRTSISLPFICDAYSATWKSSVSFSVWEQTKDLSLLLTSLLYSNISFSDFTLFERLKKLVSSPELDRSLIAGQIIYWTFHSNWGRFSSNQHNLWEVIAFSRTTQMINKHSFCVNLVFWFPNPMNLQILN